MVTTTTLTRATPVECSQIKVDDDIVFLGAPHRITSIEPYRHPGFLGPWRMAHDAYGWTITLIDGQTLDVVPA